MENKNIATERRSVPQLRFPEFDGEWKEQRLEKVFAEFKSGQNITAKNISDDDIYPVYGGNGLRGYTNSYTHEGFYLLIGRQGALCGNINRANGKTFISEHAIACKSNENSDTEWLAQRLDYLNLNRLSESSAQPGLSVNKLLRLKLYIPTLQEQKKIADFLTTVDSKLQALKKKKSLLEAYKKGVMQKIFSQELRFKQDASTSLSTGDGSEFADWEVRKLGEFFIERNVKAPKNDQYPLMAFVANKGVTPKGERYNREFLVNDGDSKKYKQTKFGDFIYSSNNLLTGSIGLNRYGSASISPVYSIFQIGELCNYQFISSYLTRRSFLNKMIRYRQGVVYGQWRIHETEFLKIKEKIPCIEEQTKIANFLTAIDNKITQAESQITHTEQYKKGLLQKMFV